MDIITRQQAISLRLNKYFTGLPCKRGHVCMRYTQMSACLECLHPKVNSEARNKSRRLRLDRQYALGHLKSLKLAVHTPSLSTMKALIYSLAVAREPVLEPADIYVSPKPGSLYKEYGPNTFLHTFKAFEEDFDVIRNANDLLTSF